MDHSRTSYICDDCKNQLVYFHTFKKDVKKYSSFEKHVRNLKILLKVEESLNTSEKTSELLISFTNNTIFVKEEASTLKDENLESHIESQEHLIEEYLESQEVETFTGVEDQEGAEEEYIYESIEGLVPNQYETEIQFEENHMEDGEEPAVKPKRQRNRVYKYPINTNDRLTTEEKDWINKQVQECTIRIDGKVLYKCPLCDIHLKIPGTLKKHLRDCHILKTMNELNVKKYQKEFRDEINMSKMIVETSDGPETIWKCQRCEMNRIFRSEVSLKVHLRYSHIRSGKIDTNFIAQCKITIDSEFGPKDAWQCQECMKVLRSRDGLRNHMKLEHPDVVAEKNCDNSCTRLNVKNRAENDNLQNILEKKRRSLKSEMTLSSCYECGVQFFNGSTKKEKSCRIHQECHKILNVLSQYFQLPKCDTTKVMFSNNDDLEKYLASDQENLILFPCEGIIAKVSQVIKEAIGNSEGENSWKCGHCGAKYQTEFDCNAHVIILHSKKLICPIDHMEFEGNRGISLFNIHMQNKHTEFFPDLEISCTYCSMAHFSSHFEKLKHMRTCSAKKFTCDHCGKKYFLKTDLLRHLKIVNGAIKYVCDICEKNCASTMDLKLHQASHSNVKNYNCSYPNCNKAFKTPAARSSHMETHSNVSYACSFCSMNFRQRVLLQRHIRKEICGDRSPKKLIKGSKKEKMLVEMLEES